MGYQINTEKELISRLRKNDHVSFQQLFHIYSKPLYLFSIRYLKSSEIAEDVVQEVFIKIWRKRKDIKTNTSFKSYLFTIALNTIRKHFNKLAEENAVKHNLLVELSNSREELECNNDYQEILDKLDKLLSAMPGNRGLILRKKKLEGNSLKEIAKEFQISTKTVEYHITEGMKFLRQEFSGLKSGGIILFMLFDSDS